MCSPTAHPCWSGIFPGWSSLWPRAPFWGYRGLPAPQLWPRCLESQPHINIGTGGHGPRGTQVTCTAGGLYISTSLLRHLCLGNSFYASSVTTGANASRAHRSVQTPSHNDIKMLRCVAQCQLLLADKACFMSCEMGLLMVGTMRSGFSNSKPTTNFFFR